MSRVRAATRADAARVATIYVESADRGYGHLPGFTRRSLGDADVAGWAATIESSDSTIDVATDGGDVVGFVQSGASRDPVADGVGEIWAIHVDPRHWRSGHGRVLLSAAIARLERRGSTRAVLWTPATHADAHAFYTATGWAHSGQSRAGGTQVRFDVPLSRARPGGRPGGRSGPAVRR